MRPSLSLLAVALWLAVPVAAEAAVSASQAATLKTTLTPLGGERAGNAAGTIPAWTGGLTKAPAGYQGPGKRHVDPYAGDKPLFSITKANLEQYRGNLTDGQIALLKSYPDSFSMPVYPTQRSAAAPQWVYDNTYKNATTAKLLDGGNGISDAYGGTPFPIPQSGVEAVWNHITRYRGSYLVRRSSEAGVQRNGSYALVTSKNEAKFRFYDPQGSYATLNNQLFYYLTFTTAPARLAGEGALVHEMLDQVKEPRQAWGYSPGQRRVRRAPTLAYDTPIEATDGLRTADDTDMYNGAPDRYDWTLVGKQEVFIPYNNYQLTSAEVKYKDLLTPGHINPKYNPLRAAPCVGGRGQAEVRRTTYLLQASPVPGRGQLERGGGRPVRRPWRAVARVDGLPEDLLRSADGMDRSGYVPRPAGAPLWCAVARQRGEEHGRLQPGGTGRQQLQSLGPAPQGWSLSRFPHK